MSFGELLRSARTELPPSPSARWASIFLSGAVLTFVISISASQAFLAASAVGYVVHFWKDRPSVSFPPVKLPLALFSLGTIVSLVGAENPNVGWFAVRKLLLFAILLLGANLVSNARHLKFLYQGLFVTAVAASVVAIVQFVVQYRAVQALYPDHVYLYMTSQRITGFMGHWMNFGGQMMLVFLALLALLLLSLVRRPGSEPEPRPRASQRWWWGVLGIVALAIVLNFTRGVWLGCFVATTYLVARRNARWLVALPILALAGFLAAPSLVRDRIKSVIRPSADSSASMRFEMWQVGLRMIERHPLTGVGANNIDQVYPLYMPPGQTPVPGFHGHLHSNFVQFAAERGLPTLAAWVWLMGALGWSIVWVRRRLVSLRWVADAALAAWLAMLVEGCFEFNFGTSPVLMLFLFVASTPFAAERIEVARPPKAAAEKSLPAVASSL